MKKTIITVVGKDTVGIIAKVCTYLADNQVNILDITTSMISGLYSLITDASACEKTTGEIAEELNTLGEEIGVNIRCQHEDIFNKMHRI